MIRGRPLFSEFGIDRRQKTRYTKNAAGGSISAIDAKMTV